MDRLGHPVLDSDMSNAGIRRNEGEHKRTHDRQLGHSDQWKSDRYHSRNQSFGHSAAMMAGKEHDDITVPHQPHGESEPRHVTQKEREIGSGVAVERVDSPAELHQGDPFAEFARGYYIFSTIHRCSLSASKSDASLEFSTRKDCRWTQTEILEDPTAFLDDVSPAVGDVLKPNLSTVRTILIGTYAVQPNNAVIRIKWTRKITEEGTIANLRETENKETSIEETAERVLIPGEDPSSVQFKGQVYQIAILPREE